jgi:hypothetical protein
MDKTGNNPCFPRISHYNAPLLRVSCSFGSSFPDLSASRIQAIRLTFLKALLALPVSDDVFAPVEKNLSY